MYMGIQNAKRIVVKVGSSLVTNNGEGLDHAAIANWAEQVAGLQKSGCEVLMVSSGAISRCLSRMGSCCRSCGCYTYRENSDRPCT